MHILTVNDSGGWIEIATKFTQPWKWSELLGYPKNECKQFQLWLKVIFWDGEARKILWQ